MRSQEISSGSTRRDPSPPHLARRILVSLASAHAPHAEPRHHYCMMPSAPHHSHCRLTFAGRRRDALSDSTRPSLPHACERTRLLKRTRTALLMVLLRRVLFFASAARRRLRAAASIAARASGDCVCSMDNKANAVDAFEDTQKWIGCAIKATCVTHARHVMRGKSTASCACG